MQTHSMSQEQFNKLKEKYKKEKDFSAPGGDFKLAEKEYALDMIID
jgi:hypothetical protein